MDDVCNCGHDKKNHLHSVGRCLWLRPYHMKGVESFCKCEAFVEQDESVEIEITESKYQDEYSLTPEEYADRCRLLNLSFLREGDRAEMRRKITSESLRKKAAFSFEEQA